MLVQIKCYVEALHMQVIWFIKKSINIAFRWVILYMTNIHSDVGIRFKSSHRTGAGDFRHNGHIDTSQLLLGAAVGNLWQWSNDWSSYLREGYY